MRLSTVEELLDLLDSVVGDHERGDRSTPEAQSFWTELLTRPGHPLNTHLPDEPLVTWQASGLLGELRGARVLDIGCGNGRNAAWLARQGASVIGIDIATGLLDAVRERMPTGVQLRTVDVLRSDLPDHGLSEGAFDLIYDSGCFHHIAPHRRITYLSRVMPLIAPGGRFGIVALGQEQQPGPTDAEVLHSGDTAGGMSFSHDDLARIFAPYCAVIEARAVAADVDDTFGATFLNAALVAT